MNAGVLYKLPFGHLPRLLMAWISTEDRPGTGVLWGWKAIG